MLRLLACFFLCIAFSSQAQLPAAWRITRYTGTNGFPEELANSVVQDSRGYLWAGTREALIRFDGQDRKTWYADPSDSNRFFSSNINVIGEYQKGKLIFLSGPDLWEVNIYNLRFQQVNRFRGMKIFTKPIRTANGNWVISTTDSFYLTNQYLEPIYKTHQTGIANWQGSVAACYLQYPYLLLYNGINNQMALFNMESHSVQPLSIRDQMLDPRAKFLLPQAYDSAKSRLYLSSYFNGNYYIDFPLKGSSPRDPVKIPSLPDGAIRKSFLLPDGNMLLGGDNGLYLTDFIRTQPLHKQTGKNGPADLGIITDISPGNNNDFWLSSTRGIIRLSLSPAAVNSFDNPIFPADDEFKSILTGPDQKLYFLTQEKSLFQVNRSNRQIKRLDSSLYYCWSAALKGNTILATGGGKKLIAYDILNGQVSHPAYLSPFYSVNTDLVTLVFQSGNGDTWYSCNGSGGIIRNPAGTDIYTQYSRNTAARTISLHYVHTAAEDSKGDIWFASTKSQILLHWNAGKQSFEELSVTNLVPAFPFNTGINHLHIDAADNLWVSLDAAALLRYNLRTKTGSYYDINKGLPSNTISCMTHDAQNRLWIASSRGIGCYLPGSEKIAVFTKKDGFPEDQFEGRGILYDSKENLVYVAGRRTMAWFNPDSLMRSTSSSKPAVYVDEIRVNQQTYFFEEGKTIRLGTNENNLEFSFSVPDYNRNSQLQFEYRLSNTATDWVSLGNKRNISFFNLPHGRYQFLVRCRHPESDIWYETSVPVSFIIRTPWHKTWWFLLLFAAACITMVVAIIRFYFRRKLEKQQAIMEKEIAIEQERTKMARELHDGLGSMLSGIKHSFSALNRELPLDEKQENRFRMNLDKLNESIIELRNISHNMASDALLKFGLENSLRDFCSNTSLTSGIPISFTALNTEHLPLKQDSSFHIFRILQELIQNIIKHANAKQVLVQISYNVSTLYITVEDDGVGFDFQEARKKQSLGLKNIETRVRLLNGQLDYKTRAGEGTSVLIMIPVA